MKGSNKLLFVSIADAESFAARQSRANQPNIIKKSYRKSVQKIGDWKQ